MYEGVGSVKGVFGALHACAGACERASNGWACWVGAVRGGVAHQGLAVASGCWQARLPRHVFALVVRMMGSLATAGLGSIS
jgi:hypothetical protein